jgi:hypothetical protein
VLISTVGADNSVRRGEGSITEDVPATQSSKGQSLIRGKTSIGETAGSSRGGQVREDIRETIKHRKRGGKHRARTTRRTANRKSNRRRGAAGEGAEGLLPAAAKDTVSNKGVAGTRREVGWGRPLGRGQESLKVWGEQ